ncbi:MAG: hypothetical protein RNU03_00305 [Candidatus Sedimenticola sp. (ex Thyasira tokunagai)]
MRIPLLSVVALLVCTTSAIAAPSSPETYLSFLESTPDKREFLFNPLSFDLKKNNVSATAKRIDLKTLELAGANLTAEVQLAAVTGNVILIRSKSLLKKMEKDLVKRKYRIVKPVVDDGAYVSIPEAFYSDPATLDLFLDGKVAMNYIEYLSRWDQKRIALDKYQEEIKKLLENRRTQDATLAGLQEDNAALQSEIETINNEIRDLGFSVEAVERENPDLFGGFRDITSILIPGVYHPHEDFYIPVLQRHLTEVDGEKHPWLRADQTHTPYMHPELVAAIDAINNKEKKALKKLGIWPLQVISPARTPYNQLTLNQSGIYSAGMFRSGHIFGTGVDFNGRAAFGKAENRKIIRALFAKYGISFPKSLDKIDPNHAYLTKYVTNKQWANNWRLKMLKGYSEAMATEAFIQSLQNTGFAEQKEVVTSAIGTVTAEIKRLTDENKALTEKRDAVRKGREVKRAELNTKRKQAAEFRSRKERGDRDTDRFREHAERFNANVPDGDSDYWESFEYTEIGARVENDWIVREWEFRYEN